MLCDKAMTAFFWQRKIYACAAPAKCWARGNRGSGPPVWPTFMRTAISSPSPAAKGKNFWRNATHPRSHSFCTCSINCPHSICSAPKTTMLPSGSIIALFGVRKQRRVPLVAHQLLGHHAHIHHHLQGENRGHE